MITSKDGCRILPRHILPVSHVGLAIPGRGRHLRCKNLFITSHTVFFEHVKSDSLARSRVLDYLDEYQRSNSETYVTYLYCDYQRTSSYSVTALVGALVRQLLCGFQNLPGQISDLFRQAHIRHRRPSCRMEEIIQVMQLLTPYIKRLFLCIDALDEYRDAVHLVAACTEFPVPTSFLFIGRPSIAQPVKYSFPGTIKRVLDYQTADINTVISALVDKDKTYHPDLMPKVLRDDIVAEVERLANGM